MKTQMLGFHMTARAMQDVKLHGNTYREAEHVLVQIHSNRNTSNTNQNPNCLEIELV